MSNGEGEGGKEMARVRLNLLLVLWPFSKGWRMMCSRSLLKRSTLNHALLPACPPQMIFRVS